MITKPAPIAFKSENGAAVAAAASGGRLSAYTCCGARARDRPQAKTVNLINFI